MFIIANGGVKNVQQIRRYVGKNANSDSIYGGDDDDGDDDDDDDVGLTGWLFI